MLEHSGCAVIRRLKRRCTEKSCLWFPFGKIPEAVHGDHVRNVQGAYHAEADHSAVRQVPDAFGVADDHLGQAVRLHLGAHAHYTLFVHIIILTFQVNLRQHRTIPALRLKHRSGGCGTASALPKCSIRHPVLSALLA